MRSLLLFGVAAVMLAPAVPAAAATAAPDPATLTIVIPAFPASSVAAAIKKAMGNMPNVRIVKTHTIEAPAAPPGVLKFAPGEVNRSTNAQIGKVVSLYPATLPKGRKGHLIVVRFPNYSPGLAVSVVQPDSKAFKLHTGERIVLVRSTHGWARVLPYNGPDLSGKQ